MLIEIDNGLSENEFICQECKKIKDIGEKARHKYDETDDVCLDCLDWYLETTFDLHQEENLQYQSYINQCV